MTTASNTSSTLAIIVAIAIAVAGWVSYFFAQQENTQLLQETELLTSKLKAQDKKQQEALAAKPSVKDTAESKPDVRTTTGMPAPKQNPIEAVQAPRKYNRLLMSEREKAIKEKDSAQARIGAILKQKRSALEDGQQLRQQLVISTKNVELLKQKIKEASSDIQKVRNQEADRFLHLRQQFEQELQQKQITISSLKDRMTVINVTAEILFGSGSARLKPKGKKVLKLIAQNLNKHTDRMVSIEGHTDNIPVVRYSPYPTNWELSSARAASAARYLEDEAGVAAGRMQVVGHGEHRPVASNATARGRAINRRIEIVLLPGTP